MSRLRMSMDSTEQAIAYLNQIAFIMCSVSNKSIFYYEIAIIGKL